MCHISAYAYVALFLFFLVLLPVAKKNCNKNVTFKNSIKVHRALLYMQMDALRFAKCIKYFVCFHSVWNLHFSKHLFSPVTLHGNDKSGFQGFLLQAREVDGGAPVGTFKITDLNTQGLSCNNVSVRACSFRGVILAWLTFTFFTDTSKKASIFLCWSDKVTISIKINVLFSLTNTCLLIESNPEFWILSRSIT